jgi:uncharacterized protein (TIGR03435 family)
MTRLGICALLLAPALAVAQALPTRFDVAAIKPNRTGSEARRATTAPGGIFTATNVTLKLLISRAYGVAEAQIEGGPGWIDTERYDVQARADTPKEMTREEARPCLQMLLAERFRLQIRHQTKQGGAYSLLVAKNGPKLKAHEGGGPSGISAASDSGKITITGQNTTTARLAEYLSGQAGRPVLDHTGLQGTYDFNLEWAADERSGGPSPFAALQEQLGLKVEAVKAPIETVVVERAEKPSAN